jgi:hypothetical protein
MKFYLKDYKNIYLFGSGKAVLPMAEAIDKLLRKKVWYNYGKLRKIYNDKKMFISGSRLWH